MYIYVAHDVVGIPGVFLETFSVTQYTLLDLLIMKYEREVLRC